MISICGLGSCCFFFFFIASFFDTIPIQDFPISSHLFFFCLAHDFFPPSISSMILSARLLFFHGLFFFFFSCHKQRVGEWKYGNLVGMDAGGMDRHGEMIGIHIIYGGGLANGNRWLYFFSFLSFLLNTMHGQIRG